MKMKPFFMFMILIVLSVIPISLTSAITAKKPKHVEIGEEILSYIIEKDRSKSLSLDVLEGKVVLLVFATVNQKFSTNVLRDIQTIVKKHKVKDFRAIGIVSSYKGTEGVEQLIEEHRLDYQIHYDAGDIISSQLGIIVYPTTLIINRNGRLAYYYPLYASDYFEQITSNLEKIIYDKEEQYLNEMIAKRKQAEAIKKAREEIAQAKVTEAVDTLNTLLEKGPPSYDLHLLLGYSLLNMQQPKKALVHFNKAKELQTDSSIVDLGMGLAFSRSGQRDKALGILTEVVKADTIAHVAYRELAAIYEDKGDIDKAIYYITKELDSLITQIKD